MNDEVRVDLDLLRDPDLDPALLAAIAERQPALRVAVAAHPALYGGLADWLQAGNDNEVAAILGARGTADAVSLDDAISSLDPITTPGELAEIATTTPPLRARVAQHPQAYEGLVSWIDSVRPAPRTSPVSLRRIVAPVAIVMVAALVSGSITVATALTLRDSSSIVVETIAGNDPVDTASPLDDPRTQPDDAGDSGDAGPAEQPGSVVPVATEPQYQPTVLILDASGSMVRDAPSGGTRMSVARTAAIAVVDGLARGAQMGLTVFGTGTGNSDAERAAGCTDVKRVIPVGDVDKDRFRSAISGITQSGFTPLGPSLRDAASQLSGNDEGLIVLVSDGVDTCSPPSSCDIAQDIRESNPGFTIHSIGFLVDADEVAREQLQCIARAGGGFYADASNPAQLAAQLRVLSDPVSTAGSVGAAGLGELKLGMSLDAAMAADPSIELGEVRFDVQYAICDSGELQFRNGRLYSIAPPEDVPTAEGVAVGDSSERIREVFRSVSTGADDQGEYLSAPPSEGSDSAYRFYLGPNGRVVSIIICICGPGGGQQSEISAWTASLDGIGPISFGTTIDEAFEIIPDPGPEARWSTPENYCPVASLATSGVGAGVHIWEPHDDRSAGMIGYWIESDPTVSNAAMPRTDRGVGLGSTVKELEAAYPDITLVKFADGNSDYAIVTARDGMSMVFRVLERRVTSIEVSAARMPITEFCS